MIFTRLALFALPLLGFASPVAKVDNKGLAVRGQTVADCLTTCKTQIAPACDVIKTTTDVTVITTNINIIITSCTETIAVIKSIAISTEEVTVVAQLVVDIIVQIVGVLTVCKPIGALSALVAQLTILIVSLLTTVGLVVDGVLIVVGQLLQTVLGDVVGLLNGLGLGLVLAPVSRFAARIQGHVYNGYVC
ncbi:hypothetical protein M231_05343 [Tremella mesenterica]|uniref:Uncharacterized protein n=1 Tax=Tremella mesenterica TaxID=5217 RepID=A0A4Q1BID3_TREME|nr:hypothetical protein M231_05343 [Tremella mesenterica]